MPQILGALGGDTLMAISTLLLILPLMFAFAEGLSSRLPSMYNSQSRLTFTNSQQVVNLRHSHTGRQLRGTGTFSGSRLIISGTLCSNKDISIFQGPDGQNSGVPQYSVQIVNNCISSCAPWNIHVSCGWFASSQLVNSNSFKRIGYNDCLVNGGRGLRYGEVLSFTYANSAMYPIRLRSASFCKS